MAVFQFLQRCTAGGGCATCATGATRFGGFIMSFFRQKLPMIFQTEAAECGLACLAMVVHYHGKRIDLPALRQRFSVSMRGATLAHIIRFAGLLDLTSRPLRIELED